MQTYKTNNDNSQRDLSEWNAITTKQIGTLNFRKQKNASLIKGFTKLWKAYIPTKTKLNNCISKTILQKQTTTSVTFSNQFFQCYFEEMRQL